MFIASEWRDYEVIDTGDGEKLERWDKVILRRPDPQAIWPKQRPELWERADAWYHRSSKGGGKRTTAISEMDDMALYAPMINDLQKNSALRLR